MKTILLHQAHDIALVDRQQGKAQDDRCQIRVVSMGVCGSDIAAYKGTSPLVTYPRVLGHEIAGEVVSIPENPQGIQAGDRVIVEPYRYCGHCYPCQLGRTNCCENLKVIGVHEDGGMQEYYAHDVHLIHRVPDTIPWELVPMVEPLSIAIHGIHRLDVKENEYVAITGAGPIGLLAAQFALHLGARPVVIDPVRERLELAQTIGVQYVFDPMQDDLQQEIPKITGGRMVEAFLEASGAQAAVRSSLDVVHYAGRIAFLGWPKEEISLPTFLITKKELDIRGSRTSVQEFPLAISLIAEKAVDVEAVITNIIRFDQIPEYVAAIAERPGDFMKVIASMN
ncbi:alcohol dehydrogenase [candidate division KSB3 bacterium]|uniref:Alcohol dehydrogenase n=1 Tax=candidate division KSB3 bacterium TaxID=2044937 RepID=A0A2G6E1P9_9BACT|nr:MAG: alcohol dehydrogenase [candidate division KSB3 bacterium]PIE28452.1 MAG: alcohol dehydrogenase [candidate division KSB3 bacterium]